MFGWISTSITLTIAFGTAVGGSLIALEDAGAALALASWARHSQARSRSARWESAHSGDSVSGFSVLYETGAEVERLGNRPPPARAQDTAPLDARAAKLLQLQRTAGNAAVNTLMRDPIADVEAAAATVADIASFQLRSSATWPTGRRSSGGSRRAWQPR